MRLRSRCRCCRRIRLGDDDDVVVGGCEELRKESADGM